MDKTTRFMVFCIEEYKKSEKLSGKQVMILSQQPPLQVVV